MNLPDPHTIYTELASAQPASVILKLFKVATQIKQYKGRIILHLPSAYPFKHLLWQLTKRLYLSKPARFNSIQFFLAPKRPTSRKGYYLNLLLKSG